MSYSEPMKTNWSLSKTTTRTTLPKIITKTIKYVRLSGRALSEAQKASDTGCGVRYWRANTRPLFLE